MAIFGNFLPYYNNFIYYGPYFGKTSDMEELRKRLKNLTEDILSMTQKRSQLVSEIQNVKKTTKQQAWDPTQELKLFKEYIKKESLLTSVQQALWLSLLIEEQAAKFSDYPLWSESVHLDSVQTQKSLYHQINPILVFLTNKEEYIKLEFNQNYAIVFKELFKYE